jgi:hypothetical protein
MMDERLRELVELRMTREIQNPNSKIRNKRECSNFNIRNGTRAGDSVSVIEI